MALQGEAFRGDFYGGWRPPSLVSDCPAQYLASTQLCSQVPFLFFDVYPGLVLYKRTVALPALGVHVKLGVALPRPCAYSGRIWKLRAYLPYTGFDSDTRGRRRFGLDTPLQALTRLPPRLSGSLLAASFEV